jgi:hypothetical protein
MAIANSTGTFMPYAGHTAHEDRSGVETTSRGRTIHKIDLRYRKINQVEYIKWCRRNLGDRGSDWDFWLANGVLYIEVWGDKAKFTYEMWKL